MAAFPYVGGTEWSTGNDHSMSYLPGYGGEAQQPSFVSDPVFNHPSAALGNTPVRHFQYFFCVIVPAYV